MTGADDAPALPRGLAALPQLLLLAPILAYRATISRFMPLCCRFTPSCSGYAVLAIRRHGALRGGWLAARRILRCQPWGGCGEDPVPPLGSGTEIASPAPIESPDEAQEPLEEIIQAAAGPLGSKRR